MCLVVGASRASVYKAKSDLQIKDEFLRQQILQVLSAHPSYGHRRIALALGIGKKRVRRVMKLYGIKAYKRKARWRKRRDERRPEAEYQNLIKGSCLCWRFYLSKVERKICILGHFYGLIHKRNSGLECINQAYQRVCA